VILESLRIFGFHVGLSRPLHLKRTTITERSGLLIEARSELGAIGWGECSPLPGFSTETDAECAQALLRLRFKLRSREIPDNLEELSGGFDRWLKDHDLPAAARFGFESAILCALADGRKATLAELLADSPPEAIAINGLIARDQDPAKEAERLKSLGFNTVKIKVGGRSVEDDAAYIVRLSELLSDDCRLRLDANRSWSYTDALRFCSLVKDCRMEYIEEPLADSKQLEEFASASEVPVALDESLNECEPESLPIFKNLAAIILRPTLLGGLERSMRFARRARMLGIRPVVSSAVESAVGTGILAAFAAACCPDTAAGLDTLNWFAEQPVREAPSISAGRISASEAFAASQSVSVEKLKECRDA
jgi:O-succinylbenzoate synthase